MRHINLTREEIILLINSVQRTIIKLEKYADGASEVIRKHRLLLKTLLEIENNLSIAPKEEPLNYYK